MMTHYYYKTLTTKLVQMTRDSESFRSLLTRPFEITKDGNEKLWDILNNEDKEVDTWMDGLENQWVDSNQDRADKGSGPTVDMEPLVEAMSGFLVATQKPIGGRGVLYANTRARVEKWRDQATTWFHEIKVKPTPLVISIDTDRLKDCFVDEFSKPSNGNGKSDFDVMCGWILKNTDSYTATDIGRIAYQIWRSKWALYNIRLKPFSKWMREFCNICGVKVPKDISPTRYKNHTGPTIDYSPWLD